MTRFEFPINQMGRDIEITIEDQDNNELQFVWSHSVIPLVGDYVEIEDEFSREFLVTKRTWQIREDYKPEIILSGRLL